MTVIKQLTYSNILTVLSIVTEKSPLRFKDVQSNLKINPCCVDKSLKQLIHLRLVYKKDDLYIITEKGKKVNNQCKELSKILREL